MIATVKDALAKLKGVLTPEPKGNSTSSKESDYKGSSKPPTAPTSGSSPQKELPKPDKKPAKWTSAGGVVLMAATEEGIRKVLLVAPKGQFGGYCVPLDTEILTRTGWKKRSDVCVGDETIGFDPKTATNRWTKITAVHDFANQELVTYGNEKIFSVRCTPNHRWMTSIASAQYGFVEAKDLLRGDRKLVLSAPMDDVSGASDVTADEAALVAWIVTDGSWSEVARRAGNWEVSVGQKKAFGKEALEELLTRMDFPHTKRTDYGGMSYYRLQAHGLKRLSARTGYVGDKAALPSFVTSLSPVAAQAFLDAAYTAEGCSTEARRCMWQNEGPCADALAIVAYRAGYLVALRDAKQTKLKKISMLRPNVSEVSCEPAGAEDVWCVSTELGTWTMRQGRYVCLTGNSWTFPKGRVDDGENMVTTAKREVKEETGIDASLLPNGYLGVAEGTSSFTHYYMMVRVSGEPGGHGSDGESEKVEWVTWAEAFQRIRGSSRDKTILLQAWDYTRKLRRKLM